MINYLFWVLYHLHKREHKAWSVLVTSSALSLFIFVYVFFIIHMLGFILNDNLFLSIENKFPNDELWILGIFTGLTLVLNSIYSRSNSWEKRKNEKQLPSYKDYISILCALILPIVLIQIIK